MQLGFVSSHWETDQTRYEQPVNAKLADLDFLYATG
jgi:hypothetical protein